MSLIDFRSRSLEERPLSEGRGKSAALRGMFSVPEMRWAGLASVLFAVGGVLQLSGAPAWSWWSLYLCCYASGGWEPGLAGLRAARSRVLDVDLLMIVAAVVAAAIGQIFDGALLIVIFATSGALEAVATKRTADSVRALLELAPEQATRLLGEVEQLTDTAELAVGDLVLVRPGELIGADAVVVSGASDVDQASITGEAVPVFKQPGSEVFAGTLNGTGALRVRVSRPASQSVVARIVALVEEASATKAAGQLFIEKIEQRYSAGVVAATLTLFLVPLAFGAALQSTLLRAMTFMIVASPCAVVLATMPPLLSAMANAGRHGVLVKSAVVMERLATIDQVAFDKTGTLTHGTPHVTEIRALTTADLTDEELLALAAAAERPSEHPLGAAIVTAAEPRHLPLASADGFSSSPGRGVSALIHGRRVEVGSPALLASYRRAAAGSRGVAEAQAVMTAMQTDGRTAVIVIIDGQPAGVLALADQVRADAASAVRDLADLTGRAPVLLTGDNEGAARRLGQQVGITHFHAGLLPEDKVQHVHALQRTGRRVLLVGDGVNDAPALAAADLGIAMGRHGSDLALDTADAVIVRDELSTVPKILDLSRRARVVVIANLIIAATVITCLVAWDLIGHLPLPLGVAGHEGSTVIVGLNGLRLLRNSAWQRAGMNQAASASNKTAASTHEDRAERVGVNPLR